MEFPGTISLSHDTLQRVYIEAAQSLIRQGFRRILLLNSHIGNQRLAAFIVHRINMETPAIAVDLGSALEPVLAPRGAGATKIRPARRSGRNLECVVLVSEPGGYDEGGPETI